MRVNRNATVNGNAILLSLGSIGISFGIFFGTSCGAHGQVFKNKTSLNEINLNETSLNETSLNETSLNETSLNEISLNEISLNEISLNEISLNEINLNKTSLNKTKDLSFSTSSNNFFLGHSLSQTSYTLNQGQAMTGTFAMAYGITNSITLATSPWLLGFYDMPNIIIRAKIDLKKILTLGLQGGHMKTVKIYRNKFKMEASYFNAIISKKWSRFFTSHLQLNVMNFFEDEKPFSIRVAKPTTPLQFSASILNEISLFQRYKNEFGVGVELGRIGLNEPLPYNHFGFSLFRKFNRILIQGGVSISATPNTNFNDFTFIGQSYLPTTSEFKKIVTHPEIQIQWFF